MEGGKTQGVTMSEQRLAHRVVEVITVASQLLLLFVIWNQYQSSVRRLLEKICVWQWI